MCIHSEKTLVVETQYLASSHKPRSVSKINSGYLLKMQYWYLNIDHDDFRKIILSILYFCPILIQTK